MRGEQLAYPPVLVVKPRVLVVKPRVRPPVLRGEQLAYPPVLVVKPRVRPPVLVVKPRVLGVEPVVRPLVLGGEQLAYPPVLVVKPVVRPSVLVGEPLYNPALGLVDVGAGGYLCACPHRCQQVGRRSDFEALLRVGLGGHVAFSKMSLAYYDEHALVAVAALPRVERTIVAPPFPIFAS